MGMKVAIIGAGTMGHALALVFALGGHEVRLTDSSMAMLDKAGGLMETALATLVAADEADSTHDAAWLHSRITRLPNLAETVEQADLVLEAIIEKPDAKRTLFAAIDAAAPAAAIIASNTSYLDPFPLIPARRQPFAAIMHWYTPPYLVDLVDIAPGPETDPRVIITLRDLAEAMGKAPAVLRRFIPGYVANRIQSAMNMEVQKLLDEGYATAEEIDTAIIEGIALRLPILGALAKDDFTGLAFRQQSLVNRMYEPPAVTTQSPTLDRLVAEGRSGVMAGAGHYDWNASPAELFAERDRRLLALKRALRGIGSMAGQGRKA